MKLLFLHVELLVIHQILVKVIMPDSILSDFIRLHKLPFHAGHNPLSRIRRDTIRPQLKYLPSRREIQLPPPGHYITQSCLSQQLTQLRRQLGQHFRHLIRQTG